MVHGALGVAAGIVIGAQVALCRAAAPPGHCREQRRAGHGGAGRRFLVRRRRRDGVNGAPRVFDALSPFWGNAQDLGVHAVVASPIGIANRVLGASSLMKLNNDVGAATLIMDGVKENDPIVTCASSRACPGEGCWSTAAARR